MTEKNVELHPTGHPRPFWKRAGGPAGARRRRDLDVPDTNSPAAITGFDPDVAPAATEVAGLAPHAGAEARAGARYRVVLGCHFDGKGTVGEGR